MNIGVMLRHAGQPGGIGAYTDRIVNALLRIDRNNRYVLIYSNAAQLGRYSTGLGNATERVVAAPNKLWWDQIAVPRLAKEEGLDLIYNPKLSIPLRTRAKTVLVMHGAAQFAVPAAYPWHDRLYFSLANRIYCKVASGIITMTNTGARDIARYMGADPRKLHAIYESYNESCRVLDREHTQAVREKYHLPERFFLFIGGISPLKNFGNILRAFNKVRELLPHNLVSVGFTRWKYSRDLELVDELGLRERVLFTNYVPDQYIPALYNLADALVFPSLYEGFGMPVLEAMACGCPVVTSITGCSPEVAGGAALLVNPYDPDDIARGLHRVIVDGELRRHLIESGLERAGQFSWEKTARETEALFESLAARSSEPAGRK